ncbi:ABC transporter permease [Haloarchaeobius sp. DYHT-AS-18]|uniref:ABC transporter permease n=1 Tax=Haloarchaeobius sp. DYHT-AS-18 TaxID=3446117 RepID=UPI003EC09107
MLDIEKRSHQLGLQVAFGAFLLTVYIIMAQTVIERLPMPQLIVEAFIIQVQDQGLLEAFYDGLQAILVGFLISVVVGIPLGLAMGVNRFVEEFADPYVNGLYVVPIAALVPAFIIWFGTGFRVRLVIVFIFAVFPIIINTFEGAKTAPDNLLEVAESFNASKRFKIQKVIIPHEVPYILAGLRLGIGRAVKGLVVTEIIVAVSGIGGILKIWSASYKLEGVTSIVLALMVLGIALPWMLKQLHKRVVWWDASH